MTNRKSAASAPRRRPLVAHGVQANETLQARTLSPLVARRPRVGRAAQGSAVGLALAFALTSCQLSQDPVAAWAQHGAGQHTVGGSSGWGDFEAVVSLQDTSGEPDLGSGSDTTDLVPIGGGAAKYNYFITDNFAIGGIVEFRTFEADPVAPLESVIRPDEYTSIHYLFSTRFYSDPLAFNERLRVFWGLDIGYIDGIELDATVEYSPSFQERVTLQGDEYWTAAPVFGASYLLADNFSCEFGGFYEIALDTTDDELVLNIPQGAGGTDANNVSGQVEPEGLILFAGLTYYF